MSQPQAFAGGRINADDVIAKYDFYYEILRCVVHSTNKRNPNCTLRDVTVSKQVSRDIFRLVTGVSALLRSTHQSVRVKNFLNETQMLDTLLR